MADVIISPSSYKNQLRPQIRLTLSEAANSARIYTDESGDVNDKAMVKFTALAIVRSVKCSLRSVQEKTPRQ